MSAKSERLKEYFRHHADKGLDLGIYGLKLIEALEKGALPADRVFTLQEAFDVVARDSGGAASEEAPEIMFERPERKALSALRMVQNTVQMALTHMSKSTANAILQEFRVIEGGDEQNHVISREDYESIKAGNAFEHPVNGTRIPEPETRISFAYALKEPL